MRKDGSRFWANVVITRAARRGRRARRLRQGQPRPDGPPARGGADARQALELEAANRQLAEYRRLVSSVRDYAIFMLDPAGHILSWNAGAQRLKGYDARGDHRPALLDLLHRRGPRPRTTRRYELEIAVREGRYEEEGWRVRKDGSTLLGAGDDHRRARRGRPPRPASPRSRAT